MDQRSNSMIVNHQITNQKYSARHRRCQGLLGKTPKAQAIKAKQNKTKQNRITSG